MGHILKVEPRGFPDDFNDFLMILIWEVNERRESKMQIQRKSTVQLVLKLAYLEKMFLVSSRQSLL